MKMKVFIDGHSSLRTIAVNDYQFIRLIFCFIAVDELLARPIIPFRGFYLKFKRTNPLIDSKSFVLHSTMDLRKGPIIIEKFSGYIDILIDHCSYKLIDLSTPSEQVLLIQCTKIIGRNLFLTFDSNSNLCTF